MSSINPGPIFGKNFTAYWSSPKYCFRSNVTAQPAFWDSSLDTEQWNYDLSKLGYGIEQRKDIGYLRPCCGTSSAYVAPDASLRTTTAGSSSTCRSGQVVVR
jgi:hypothetical protein